MRFVKRTGNCPECERTPSKHRKKALVSADRGKVGESPDLAEKNATRGNVGEGSRAFYGATCQKPDWESIFHCVRFAVSFLFSATYPHTDFSLDAVALAGKFSEVLLIRC